MYECFPWLGSKENAERMEEYKKLVALVDTVNMASIKSDPKSLVALIRECKGRPVRLKWGKDAVVDCVIESGLLFTKEKFPELISTGSLLIKFVCFAWREDAGLEIYLWCPPPLECTRHLWDVKK